MAKLNIGAVMPRYNTTYNDVLALARKVQAWGFDSLWVTDHLQPKHARTILEPWTTITTLARDIPDLFLGTMALCYSYRYPAVLAHMAASLYHISGGRFILGVGAGSRDQRMENEVLGIEFPESKSRISQFEEYIMVLKGLQSSGSISVTGTRFSLRQALCNVIKHEEQHPPLWIGGRNLLMFRLIAQWGEGWNYFCEKIGDYRKARAMFEKECNRAGRDPSAISYSLFSGILIASSAEELKKKLRKAATDRGITEEKFFGNSATAVFGTTTECANQISEFIFRHYTLHFSRLRF